ncbi:MAG TPA: copper oxidase, partial [Leptolyngbya sp.]|nr:copper oxidase [Leptolyngbya sp.]
MSASNLLKSLSRRQLIQLGLLSGTGLAATAVGLTTLTQNRQNRSVVIPPLDIPQTKDAANPLAVLREFDYGTVTQENGRTVREFRVEARTSPLKLNGSTTFITWNLNGVMFDGLYA